MKKSLTDQHVRSEVIARINMLAEDTLPKWGQMNVNQMLLHLYRGLQIAYGDIVPTVGNTPKLDAMLSRFLIMNTDLDSPETDIETYPELDLVAQGIFPKNFEEQQKQLLQAVKKFPEKPTITEHPIHGEYNEWNWGRISYLHIDHHLKQFGV